MFNLFKSNPVKKLKAQHIRMLEEAVQIQRSGDLKKYAFHMEAIEKLEKQLEDLQKSKR
ncbi:MAG: Lacal_2735 family protein [Cyclobacteriaceae bacterium]|nr:Lacal_2735 family protein [Cyclobacteriaceae bacterium]